VVVLLFELESLFLPDPRERAIAQRIQRAFGARSSSRTSEDARASELSLLELERRRPGAVVARTTASQRAVARRVARAFAREHRICRLSEGPELQALARRRPGCVRSRER
jgi:hypothetical protein